MSISCGTRTARDCSPESDKHPLIQVSLGRIGPLAPNSLDPLFG